MPGALFNIHPVGRTSEEYDMPDCCLEDLECQGSSKIGETEQVFHQGDYNYICKVPIFIRACDGDESLGPPLDCKWTGRGYPLPGSQPLPY